jgi:hypothetical protein
MKVMWENDRPVPVGKTVRSSWVDMPNQERNRQAWLYPVLRTGQADSAMKHYLEAEYQRKHDEAIYKLRMVAAKLRAKRDGV